MALTEITAKKKVGDIDKVATIAVDFGNDLEDCIKKFGSDVVFSNTKASFKITAQSAMRRYLETGKTQDEVSTAMASWKPGVALERTVDAVAAITSQWSTYSDEKKKEILAMLKGK